MLSEFDSDHISLTQNHKSIIEYITPKIAANIDSKIKTKGLKIIEYLEKPIVFNVIVAKNHIIIKA